MSIRRLKARGLGRLELLGWLNELLETDYTKIEHLADGIAYCQMLDALHPGKVNLAQVNFHAKSQNDYERNFRVLRRAFHACEIQKEIPVRKLVEGVFQEHFEFLHWVHDYAHKTYPDAVRKYQGFARRQELLGNGTATGALSLSLASLGHTNMNLVPSYSVSSKAGSDGFRSTGRLALMLDIIDPEEVPDDLTLDDLVGLDDHQDAQPSATPNSPSRTRVSLLVLMDPLLRYVQHSYETTLHAHQVLTQLEKTKAMLFDAAPATGKNPKKPSKASTKTTTKTAAKSKPRTQTPTKSSDPDPPFLAPQLNQLIDVLAEELSGRANDLALLENEVQSLLSLEPSSTV